jgi:hypothetical protein
MFFEMTSSERDLREIEQETVQQRDVARKERYLRRLVIRRRPRDARRDALFGIAAGLLLFWSAC